MASHSSKILAITGLTVLGGAIAYAAYFDHRRRNDADFRKKLRKEKKRAEKSAAQSRESLLSSQQGDTPAATLRETYERLQKEEAPASAEEREAYFMQQVSIGEQLSNRGPAFYLEAASAFFRALRVYPAPLELIVIYEKTVPQPIFKMVIEMMNYDVKNTVEGYYDEFPPKSMNTRIEIRGDRRVLVADKDISSGELIYKEKPVVAILDFDLQDSGKYCAHCLRSIDGETSVDLPEEANPLSSTFCSKECLDTNKAQSHNLLFTSESPLPSELTQPVPLEEKIQAEAARKQAQEKLVKLIKEEPNQAYLLVARFIARQVAVETNKLMTAAVGARNQTQKSDYTDALNGAYSLSDHIERLRFLEVKPSDESHAILGDVLQTALPGLEQFITGERHATLLGKMAYNAYGVYFGEGRDDKPAPTARPEDVEKTRTPYGTDRQVGSAFYTLSSYLTHSCEPNAQPSFSSGTSELHLIAKRDLKEGDELHVAFVDVVKKEGESTIECRRRRRVELARGWRFACPCERCAQEAQELSAEESAAALTEEKDGSKVETTHVPL